MPTYLLSRMPEDLLVRKCINIIIEIIRNKKNFCKGGIPKYIYYFI